VKEERKDDKGGRKGKYMAIGQTNGTGKAIRGKKGKDIKVQME
jgi:hypothetical protein